MGSPDYIGKIEAVLKNLEERGDLVIATYPDDISKEIYSAIVSEMLTTMDESDFIIECNIPYLLEKVRKYVCATFSESLESATTIVNAFYHRLLQSSTPQQVAELIHHDTPFEIALRSYYHCKLEKEDNRDLDYIDWRKQYYDDSFRIEKLAHSSAYKESK